MMMAFLLGGLTPARVPADMDLHLSLVVVLPNCPPTSIPSGQAHIHVDLEVLAFSSWHQ